MVLVSIKTINYFTSHIPEKHEKSGKEDKPVLCTQTDAIEYIACDHVYINNIHNFLLTHGAMAGLHVKDKSSF